MSIDTRPPQNSAPPAARYEEPAKPRLDLSVTQVLGGALAAMTAAYLGSRLSVAGTVVGAALASIVAAVAGSVYTASLRSTRARVQTVWQGRVAGSPVPASVELLEGRDSADPASVLAQSSAPATGNAAGTLPVRRRSVSWKSVAGAALAAFALAGVALTGVELATGSALSGGDGTTINQVTEQVTEPRTTDPKPAASASPEPSEEAPSATATSSPEPSEPPGPEVSSSPEPSLEPTLSTPTPAPVPSATTPAEPSPTTNATPGPQG